ncbi:GAF domain-containing protein [Chlorobium phaeovibrioides]|nr:GAF domain-containing protein [Chlorobium phaeovibrioides]
MNKKAPRTTPQKRTPKAHSHTARSTKKLMTSLSSLFISVQYEDIDEMVKSTLSLIGEFLKADRSYIFEFNDDRTLMDNTHEWCREGIEPQIDFLKGLPTDMFPFLMERIQGNETLMIPRISELPPEAAAEKDVLEAQNIKSLIIIPLASGKSSFGYIGLDAVAKEMVWGNDTAPALTFAGGIIANALQRQRAEKCIHAELDLAIRLNASTSFHETLRFCLEAAISVSGMDCGGIYLFNKERQELSLTYQIGFSDEFVRKEGLYPADSKQFKLILAGKPVYHHYRNTSSADRESVRREQLLAISIIPITSKGEVIGNLNVASHTLYQVPEYSRKALESVTAHIGAASCRPVTRRRLPRQEAISNCCSTPLTIFSSLSIRRERSSTPMKQHRNGSDIQLKRFMDDMCSISTRPTREMRQKPMWKRCSQERVIPVAYRCRPLKAPSFPLKPVSQQPN